jgi:hypothetical protein
VSDAAPILDYAPLGCDAPPPTTMRLIREEMDDGGVRFTDPPAGWRGMAGSVFLCTAGAVLATILGLFAFMPPSNHPDRLVQFGTAFAIATATALVWAESYRPAHTPTVIEASAAGLRVSQPTLLRPRMTWPIEQVRDVRAGLAIPTLRGDMVSTLVVLPRLALGARLLENFDAREVRWVAQELRRALGIR